MREEFKADFFYTYEKTHDSEAEAPIRALEEIGGKVIDHRIKHSENHLQFGNLEVCFEYIEMCFPGNPITAHIIRNKNPRENTDYEVRVHLLGYNLYDIFSNKVRDTLAKLKFKPY